MIAVVLQVFVSLVLVASSVILFIYVVRHRTLEHSDRLALSPLDDDATPRRAHAAARAIGGAREPVPAALPPAVPSADVSARSAPPRTSLSGDP